MRFRPALLAAALVIPLAAPGQPIAITGEVVGVDGKPLAGAEARLLPRLSAYDAARLRPIAGAKLEALAEVAAAAEPLLAMSQLHGSALSDPQGEFFLQVPAGLSHRLEARHPDYAPKVVQVPAPAAGKPVPRLRLVLTQGIAAFGQVTTLDGEPIPGARVVLVRAAEADDEKRDRRVPPRKLEATANGEGRFSFVRLAADIYHLGAIAQGFAPTEVRGVAILDDPRGAGRLDLGTLALEPAVTLSGHVVDAAGAPVDGARITVFESDSEAWHVGQREQITESGADGRFAVGGLAPGEASLHADKDDASADQTVTLPTPEPVDVVLHRQLQIVLRVLDEASKPVTSFRYSVEALAAASLSMRGMSGGVAVGNRTGETSVDLDGPGLYRVYVEAKGLVPTSVLVEVGPEGLPAPLTFVLSAGATVVGRVTDPEGAPLPEAEVALVSDRWSPPAKTDGTGSFRLAGVAPGPRTLSASRTGYQKQAQSLEVRPGENRVDFQLAPGLTVSGRVVTADGAPVAGAAVSLDWNWGGPPVETVSAADGSFTLAGVAPGVYQVKAAKPGFAQGDGVPLSVGSTPVQDLEVRLEVGGTVRGQVTGLDFKALAQVQISVLPTVSADTQPARPDFQGAFRLDHLPAGSWTVVAEAGSRIIQRQVEVTSGREAHVELAFKSGFRLSGRVTRRGEPVAGVNVRATGLDNDSLGQMTTDADGAFGLPDLAAGRHLLQVGDDLARTLFERTLEITADRELVLELPAQRVSGRVVDPAGDPVEQVRIDVEPEDGTGLSTAAISGADGHFTAQGLTPGRHRVVASKDGFASAEARLTVPPDGDVDGVELILTPAALLTLEIAGPTGGTPAKIDAALFSGEGHAVTLGTYTPRANGTFEIRGAAPGTYRLLVGTSNGVAVTPVRVPGRHHVDLALPASVMVRVPALQSLMQAGRVTVFDGEGRPFSPVIAGHLEPSWDLYFGSTRVWSLPAGSWRLVVTGPEGRRWERQVAVTAGQDAEVVVE